MNQHSNCTFKEKYLFIQQNSHRLGVQEQKTLSELHHFKEDQKEGSEPSPSQFESFAKSVKLQTLYKCCMPMMYSLHWEEDINFKTTRPLTGIVAFPQTAQPYYSIDQKFVTWVQSGGTRVTPVKANIPNNKLSYTLNNISALVIPQIKTQTDLHFFQNLAEQLTNHKELPVLAMGNSALLLLSYLKKTEGLRDSIRLEGKVKQVGEAMVFATHSDPYFANLSIKTRLQIQSKPKVRLTNGVLSVSVWSKLDSDSQALALGRQRGGDYQVMLMRENLLHYCFSEVKLDVSSPQSISYCHKIMVSFAQQMRKQSRPKSQISDELGHFKMVYKNQKYHYNCEVKLPKV